MSCRDLATLALVRVKVLELRTYIAAQHDACHSIHAEAELDILADTLANAAESLELCAMECSDLEQVSERWIANG